MITVGFHARSYSGREDFEMSGYIETQSQAGTHAVLKLHDQRNHEDLTIFADEPQLRRIVECASEVLKDFQKIRTAAALKATMEALAL